MDKIIELMKLIQERKEYGEFTVKYEAGNFVMLEKKKKILLSKRKEA
jgi:hypothetical protein